MDLKTKLIYLLIDLIIPLALGYACRYQSKLGKDVFQRMMVLNICALYPVLSLLTIWTLHINYSLFWLPVVGVLICGISGAAAYFRVGKFSSELDKGSYILSAVLSNTVTLGGLCAYILYGEVGYAYTQMIVMLQNIVMFTICFPLAQYYYQKSVGGKTDKQSLTSLFINRNQLPVVGMSIGLLLNLTGIVRPSFLEAFVDPMVHLGAWTALIPIGYAIDTSGMRSYYSALLDLIPIKFVLTPVLAYLASSLVITDKTILNVIVIIAAMPTAINAVIGVHLHKLNVNIATAAFVLTTAVCLGIELPVLFFWMSVQ